MAHDSKTADVTDVESMECLSVVVEPLKDLLREVDELAELTDESLASLSLWRTRSQIGESKTELQSGHDAASGMVQLEVVSNTSESDPVYNNFTRRVNFALGSAVCAGQRLSAARLNVVPRIVDLEDFQVSMTGDVSTSSLRQDNIKLHAKLLAHARCRELGLSEDVEDIS